MIIVNTVAYNAEKTIKRAVDSILNQTYKHFIYYIIDNGSTDRTSEILAEYDKKDDRVRVLQYEMNSKDAKKRGIPRPLSVYTILECAYDEYPEGRYFCRLDADDEYLPTFFEKSLALIKEHSLDIVACSTQLICEQPVGGINRDYSVQNDFILNETNFTDYFIECCRFIHTLWGKMYSLPIVRRNFVDEPIKISIPYGKDTVDATNMFRYAKRVGLLAEKLHRYYISKDSVSSTVNKKLVSTPHIYHKAHSDFLKSKCGRISPRQKKLYKYYYSFTKSIAWSVLKKDISVRIKFNALLLTICTYIKTVSFWGLCVTLRKLIALFLKRSFHFHRKTEKH